MPRSSIRRLLAPVAPTIVLWMTSLAAAAEPQHPAIVFAAREAPRHGRAMERLGKASPPAALGRADSRDRGVDLSGLVPRTELSEVALVLVLAGLALGALWLALPTPSTESSDAASPKEEPDSRRLRQEIAPTEEGLLGALIAGSLPVVEEALLFPALAQIHGRPVANHRYRVERAEPIAGPHFAPVEKESVFPDSSFRMTISRVDRPASAVRGPGSLERMLAAVDGGLS